MQSEWAALPLADAGVLLIDCDHRTPPSAGEGYPYIAIPQLKDGHVTLEGVRRISREHLDEWTKKLKPREHDVIVVRRCNSGVSAVVPRGAEWAIGQNLVVLRADGRHVRPEFLRWLVRGEDWWEQVRKHINVGAVFDSLKCRDIPKFEVRIPPLPDQQRICELLGAIDDRIDLLRQTNATLEAIAKALFKSWFIDFDPVRAKAEGRTPDRMDATTAALFPANLEESTMGLIPRGWQVTPFSETVNVIGGGTPKTSVAGYWGGDIPWFSVVDAPAPGQVFTIATEKTITPLGEQNSSTRLLPTWATIISARGTVGRLAMIGRPMAMNQSCYGLTPRQEGCEAITYLSAQLLVEDLKRLAHGGVFDTITRDTLASVHVVMPSPTVSVTFAETVRPLFEQILNGVERVATLTALRDTLIPRLISGQLRLPEAHAQVEESLA